MRKVISNSSPLIALSKISQLELIEKLFGKIIIPKAVYEEVVVKGGNRAGVNEIKKAVDDWIQVKEIKDRKEVNVLQAVLDYGEAEVIVLAQEINADLLILDNREPRIFAKHLGFKIIGTIGIILLANKKGIINKPLEKILELREKGFYISNSLLNEIIKEIKDR